MRKSTFGFFSVGIDHAHVHLRVSSPSFCWGIERGQGGGTIGGIRDRGNKGKGERGEKGGEGRGKKPPYLSFFVMSCIFWGISAIKYLTNK